MRSVLKTELTTHLRTARQMRQAKGGTTKSGLGQIVDTISIRECLSEAEDRAIPGHWEGNLLSGEDNTHIATLVERPFSLCDAAQGTELGYSDGKGSNP
jgi:IS30 family transposase